MPQTDRYVRIHLDGWLNYYHFLNENLTRHNQSMCLHPALYQPTFHQKKIEALHLRALSGVRRQGEGRGLCAESRNDRLRCLEARRNALQAA